MRALPKPVNMGAILPAFCPPLGVRVAALIENFLIQGRDTEPDLGCPEDREPLPFELPGEVERFEFGQFR